MSPLFTLVFQNSSPTCPITPCSSYRRWPQTFPRPTCATNYLISSTRPVEDTCWPILTSILHSKVSSLTLTHTHTYTPIHPPAPFPQKLLLFTLNLPLVLPCYRLKKKRGQKTKAKKEWTRKIIIKDKPEEMKFKTGEGLKVRNSVP